LKTVLLAQASAILRLLQEVREVAPLNVLFMLVTTATFHVLSPFPKKLDAPRKR
jgi:hypothetical protein